MSLVIDKKDEEKTLDNSDIYSDLKVSLVGLYLLWNVRLLMVG